MNVNINAQGISTHSRGLIVNSQELPFTTPISKLRKLFRTIGRFFRHLILS